MKEQNYKICDQCGGKMLPATLSKVFHVNGKEIEIRGIEGFQCENCGEVVFASQEFRMIDRVLRSVDLQPAIDILNLEETAEYLRVSNQTIYNMIRDKRIKAYKIGREWRFMRSDILAYLDSTTNSSQIPMAAKGGITDPHDLSIIIEEIEKRKQNHDS